MDRFVRRENIKRYRNLLRGAKDEAGRRLIQELLIKEEQKEVAARTPLHRPHARTLFPPRTK